MKMSINKAFLAGALTVVGTTLVAHVLDKNLNKKNKCERHHIKTNSPLTLKFTIGKVYVSELPYSIIDVNGEEYVMFAWEVTNSSVGTLLINFKADQKLDDGNQFNNVSVSIGDRKLITYCISKDKIKNLKDSFSNNFYFVLDFVNFVGELKRHRFTYTDLFSNID